MKTKLIAGMLLVVSAIAIDANPFKEFLKTAVEGIKATKEVTEECAQYVKSLTWDAPVGACKNGGKITVSVAAAILAADQAYCWYVNKPIITRRIKDFPDADPKSLEKYYSDLPKKYMTRPTIIERLHYKLKENPDARNAIVGIAVSAISMAIMLKLQNKLSEGEAKFKFANPETIETTFDSIIGSKDAKEELTGFIDFIKNPGKYNAVGVKPPKGCILWGPPGTGKTELARAAAKTAGISFLYINGSDFNGKWRGSGTEQAKKMYEEARKNGPCMVFIDECNSVFGRDYSCKDTGTTVDTFKAIIEGFESQSDKNPVYWIGATNHIEDIDSAISRRLPGIKVAPPTLAEAAQIFEKKLYGGTIKTEPGINPTALAEQAFTQGFTGANVTTIVNTAAMITAQSNKPLVSLVELTAAIKRFASYAKPTNPMASQAKYNLTASI